MKFITDYFPHMIANYIIAGAALIIMLFIIYMFFMKFGKGLYLVAMNINDSFKIKEGGYSARKLSAAAAVWISIYMSIRFTDDKTLVTIIAMWLMFALLLLGVVAWSDVMKLKILSGSGGSGVVEKIEKTMNSETIAVTKVENT